MTTISRNAQLLKFFAQQYGRQGVPRKRLVKLVYMADVLARQYLGRPISSFEYIKDHYGPNAPALRETVDELVGSDLAEQTQERDGEYRTIRLRAGGRPVPLDFSLGENEILSYIVTNYLSMDLDEFIDTVVKDTDPCKRVDRHHERLPMEIVDSQKRDEVGFDLERILHAEQDAAEGRYSSLADFANELYADIAARHEN